MIYLISDTHWGHENIIKMCNRPFANVDEMDEILIKNWNDTVSKEDTVYHLGDVFWSQRAAYTIMPQLNGKIVFICGNHDKSLRLIARTFPEHTYYGLDKDVDAILTIREPVRAILCHYPLDSWNGAAHNVWHFHGHTHNNHTLSQGHRVNVSVENIGYTPIEINYAIKQQQEKNNEN